LGKIGGRHHRILTPMNSILVFRPQMTVQSFIKFYSKLRPQDRHTNTQIHRQRDASDLIICSMLCNSNGTDNYADVCVCVTLMKFVFCFLTVGYFVRSRLCYSVASVVCPTVRVVSDVRIVAKRCVLEQKLLFTTYSKSYMRNRLVLK